MMKKLLFALFLLQFFSLAWGVPAAEAIQQREKYIDYMRHQIMQLPDLNQEFQKLEERYQAKFGKKPQIPQYPKKSPTIPKAFSPLALADAPTQAESDLIQMLESNIKEYGGALLLIEERRLQIQWMKKQVETKL